MFNIQSNKMCNRMPAGWGKIGDMDKRMERLYEAAEKLGGVVGQSALARALNVSPQTVNNWESRGVSRGGMMAAEKIFGCSAMWIFSGEGPMVAHKSDLKNSLLSAPEEGRESSGVASNVVPGPVVRGEVPLISWVQAGEYQSVVDNYTPGCGAEMIPTTVPVNRHTYALTVKGDSMTNPNGWPSFPEGMVIIVEPEFESMPGDFVIVKNGAEEATFKQLVKDGGDWYLKPLNPRYPIKPLTPDLRVVGVVRGYGGLLR